ncbi:unnamed protein product [Arctogadus glacialis]
MGYRQWKIRIRNRSTHRCAAASHQAAFSSFPECSACFGCKICCIHPCTEQKERTTDGGKISALGTVQNT